MKRKKLILGILLGLLSLILTVTIPQINPKAPTITIALAVPQSNASEQALLRGKGMIQGVQFYLDKVNEEGGINGKELRLDIYDDQSNPEVAVQVAQKIVNSSAVAVIGHYTSSASLAAGEIYQQFGIPAVSGSATADQVTDNEWYFRTIFNNSDQGKFIANYVHYALGSDNVYLIYGDSAYSLTLGNEIQNAFQSFEKELLGEVQIKGDENLDSVGNKIVEDLLEFQEEGNEPDMIIMAIQNSQAVSLLPKFKINNLNYPIIGGDSLADVAIAQHFADTPEEQDNKGFFTNGLHALSPVIFDVTSEEGQQFKNEFENRYGHTPGWISASYYDAAHVIVQGIQNSLEAQENNRSERLTGHGIAQERLTLKEGLKAINSPKQAVKSPTRDLYFDRTGNGVVPIFVGVFSHGQFISAFTQIHRIQRITLVANLDEQLESGEIFKVGNQYLQKKNIVYVGIDINEVNNIDEKSSSYLTDFYLWFRYKGNIRPDDIEFMNYHVERLDSGEKLSLADPIDEGQEDGVNYVIYRMKADFYEKFDFKNYPFDRQTLSIRFRHNSMTRNKLIYVVDSVGMRDTHPEEVIRNFKKNRVFGTITDWQVTNAIFYPSINENQSTLGYRRFLNTNWTIKYSQFNAVIEIERDFLSFSLKNLLPLWFFVAVAYSLMFLPFENISVEGISGLLLAVVFYHLSLLEALPDGVGYVVALDYAFYFVYGLLGLELLLIILADSPGLKYVGLDQIQLINFGKLLFPLVWIAGCMIFYFSFF